MPSNTQIELNSLANEVQSVFTAETGRKLGFSKAKELAAKLSGLRNSNVRVAHDKVVGPEVFFILPSSGGPDYDKHFAAPSSMSERELDAVVAKLRAFFSLLEAEEDDEQLGIAGRLQTVMKGETDTGEFLTKYAEEVFGVRYVNPTEYFAWDNPHSLVCVNEDNIDTIFAEIQGNENPVSQRLPAGTAGPIEFSYFMIDKDGRTANWVVRDGKESCSWVQEQFGRAPTEAVQFAIQGETLHSVHGDIWRYFEEAGHGLPRLVHVAIMQGKVPALWDILNGCDVLPNRLLNARDLLKI